MRIKAKTTDITDFPSQTGNQNKVLSVGASGLQWISVSLGPSDITNALTYTPVNKAGDTMLGTLTLALDPVNNLEAATKQYVDNLVSGLDVKKSVRAIATSNITLSGTQTIDGVSLIAGNRVLVAGQNTPSQNGIYVVAAGSWSRSTDADNSPAGEVTSGMYTFVEEGTTYAGSGWVLTSSDAITLGTTSLTFVQFSRPGVYSFGSGLSLSGSSVTNSGVLSFNTRTGAVALTAADVNTALSVTAINFYEVAAGVVGKPGNADKILVYPVTRAFTLPVSLTGSKGYAETVATSSTTFTIYKNTTNIGSFNFAAGGSTPTFTFASAISFAVGDRLVIQAPATADNTLADFGIVLVGTLS